MYEVTFFQVLQFVEYIKGTFKGYLEMSRVYLIKI